MLGDQDIPLTQTQMVNRVAGNQPVRHRGIRARAMSSCQRPASRPTGSIIRRLMVPSDAIWVTMTLISPVCPCHDGDRSGHPFRGRGRDAPRSVPLRPRMGIARAPIA